jgi:hypothetical protein
MFDFDDLVIIDNPKSKRHNKLGQIIDIDYDELYREYYWVQLSRLEIVMFYANDLRHLTDDDKIRFL